MDSNYLTVTIWAIVVSSVLKKDCFQTEMSKCYFLILKYPSF